VQEDTDEYYCRVATRCPYSIAGLFAAAGGDKTGSFTVLYHEDGRFKDKSFARFAHRAHISDDDLLNFIAELDEGAH